MVLEKLPEDFVLSPAQIAAVCGFSVDTLRRLWKRGEGPARMKLSPRRDGSTVKNVRAYQVSRETAATTA